MATDRYLSNIISLQRIMIILVTSLTHAFTYFLCNSSTMRRHTINNTPFFPYYSATDNRLPTREKKPRSFVLHMMVTFWCHSFPYFVAIVYRYAGGAGGPLLISLISINNLNFHLKEKCNHFFEIFLNIVFSRRIENCQNKTGWKYIWDDDHLFCIHMPILLLFSRLWESIWCSWEIRARIIT